MELNGTFRLQREWLAGWPTGQVIHQTNVLDNGALKVVYGANSGSHPDSTCAPNTMDVVNPDHSTS
ncbi:MAG: hypothetical protein IPN30_06505 [Flavobacteriales bacterium]|nr:hypothetical protein [Flavobacteriales bacterium]